MTLPFSTENTQDLYWVRPLSQPDTAFFRIAESNESRNGALLGDAEREMTKANVDQFLASDNVDQRNKYPSAALLFPLAEMYGLTVVLWTSQLRQQMPDKAADSDGIAFMLDALIGDRFWDGLGLFFDLSIWS